MCHLMNTLGMYVNQIIMQIMMTCYMHINLSLLTFVGIGLELKDFDLLQINCKKGLKLRGTGGYTVIFFFNYAHNIQN